MDSLWLEWIEQNFHHSYDPRLALKEIVKVLQNVRQKRRRRHTGRAEQSCCSTSLLIFLCVSVCVRVLGVLWDKNAWLCDVIVTSLLFQN